ncbi:fumarylacetoacetase [Saccharomonospora viridis]|jgi:fumarylacetoacetase|uniref:fumarylacetoacetase n=1 Tax=Saccharomonospora viridis (strain ATCC 15386 / DSM 43017 / JCM 3036 / CCUG 5913 / NBRC 12207 / NCIMB 9602 / P101) TaxID=471857 RepID=C7MVQ4_SACVD|nr:fumarylacetoacetase [Saccharomonospora viridis]ACU95773.1 fumarylacetoacetate hydrolase [Saccharomonospora viridis DSM 43017]
MTTIEIPDGSLFGVDNLPYGVFSTPGTAPRVGVRVGDSVVDLAMALGDDVFAQPTLNAFMAQGYRRWVEVRERITELVSGDVPDAAVHPVDEVRLHLPVEVGDYVDFYASEHHATNLGKLFRPGAPPLMPNWKHLPVGYHGRAGTVILSGTDIVRPCGQRKAPDQDTPTFGESQRLDIEAELGFIVGTGSELGTPVPVDEFGQRVFGVVILNDWSARDIQSWEYVPLGPFLGKSFATSISPWVVPLLALESARVDTPKQDPEPLPYLRETSPWGLDIDLEVELNGQVVSRPPYREMYWSPAQMLAHMTVNGASSRTGDLFASGTISGPERDQRGAFIEITWGGKEPLQVGGEERTFLQDGDEVVLRATAPGAGGGRIGFGEVRTRILPAKGVAK